MLSPGSWSRGFRRRIRSRRRPIAATLAALGVIVALTTLRPAAQDAGAETAGFPLGRSAVGDGEVAVPVLLASSAIAATLAVGDTIDIVGITGQETATARIVAPGARVLDLPASGSALSGSSAAVVLVAVDEEEALPLAAASAGGALSVLIRGR